MKYIYFVNADINGNRDIARIVHLDEKIEYTPDLQRLKSKLLSDVCSTSINPYVSINSLSYLGELKQQESA